MARPHRRGVVNDLLICRCRASLLDLLGASRCRSARVGACAGISKAEAAAAARSHLPRILRTKRLLRTNRWKLSLLGDAGAGTATKPTTRLRPLRRLFDLERDPASSPTCIKNPRRQRLQGLCSNVPEDSSEAAREPAGSVEAALAWYVRPGTNKVSTRTDWPCPGGTSPELFACGETPISA